MDIFLFLLLVIAFIAGLALLIVTIKNWQHRTHDSSSLSGHHDGPGHRRPLVPSFTFVYSTGAATGITGTVPLVSQSPLATSSLVSLVTGGNQIQIGKHGAGRYRVDFLITAETGSTGPIKAEIFVDNTAIASTQYGLPTVSNSGTIQGFGILLLECQSIVELRITSGTVILGSGKTNASVMLQRIGTFCT